MDYGAWLKDHYQHLENSEEKNVLNVEGAVAAAIAAKSELETFADSTINWKSPLGFHKMRQQLHVQVKAFSTAIKELEHMKLVHMYLN